MIIHDHCIYTNISQCFQVPLSFNKRHDERSQFPYRTFLCSRGIAKGGTRKKRSKETDSLSVSAGLSKNVFTDRP